LLPVHTRDEGGRLVATLTSVAPSVEPLSSDTLAATLQALGWSPGVMDDALPAYVAFAGNYDPVLAVSSRQVLADLDYDYAAAPVRRRYSAQARPRADGIDAAALARRTEALRAAGR